MPGVTTPKNFLLTAILSAIILALPHYVLAATPGNAISIPSINLYAETYEMRIVQQNGLPIWDIQPWEARVGHLERTAEFGTDGNIVMGGHSALPDGSAGVFANLDKIQIGDTITVNEQGITYEYRVIAAQVVAVEDISIVLDTDNQLALITCYGDFDTSINDYPVRYVVIAEPVQ